jgi:hypothetical protein
LFYRGFRCFSAARVQKHYKKRFAKNGVEKFLRKIFTKKSTKNPKPIFFFLDYVVSRFWAYLGEGGERGVQKQHLFNHTKNLASASVFF